MHTGNLTRFRVDSGAPDHIAQALLRSLQETGDLSIAGLRALSPLSDKAQVLVDKAVVKVGLERLTVAADLMAAGLTYPLTDPLSVTQVEWESVSKTGGAQRTMAPSARGENQMPARTVHRVPIYLTTDDFSIGIRTLKMSQRVGLPLDTSLVEDATRRVNESIEDAVINGAGMNVGGYTAYGLLNAPNANTFTLNPSWATATGAEIFGDVEDMIALAQADKKFGPYHLYVGTTYGNKLDADYSTAKGDNTIKERLLKIESLRAVRTADQMPANTAVLVQMTSDVVELIDGQRPTVIPWVSVDGFTLYWMVMAIMVPRIRSDYDGQSGIVIGTTA